MNGLYETRPVVVVSGGLGFLGSAIARELRSKHFSVAVLYRSDPTDATKKIFDELLALGVGLYQCDLSREGHIHETIELIERSMGPIVAGIHAAHSRFTRKRLTEIDTATFREQFSSGVFGGFNFFKEISGRMVPRKNGVLVGLTTRAIKGGVPSGNFGGYIAAKSALDGLLKELAGAMRGSGIRVYALAPGFLEGGLNDDLHPRLFELMREAPVGDRPTTVEDVARKVTALISGDHIDEVASVIIEDFADRK